jgi:hypothetical protein
VVIERLLFQLSTPEWVQDFINADNQVWLPWLQRQPGFIQKTHQVYPGGQVETLLFWKNKASWDRAASSPELPTIDLMFRNRIGSIYYLVRAS